MSAATLAHAGQPEVEYAMPLEDDEDRLDVYYDDEPLSSPDQPKRLFT